VRAHCICELPSSLQELDFALSLLVLANDTGSMKNYLEKLSSSTLTYRIKFIKISTQPYDKVIYLKAAVGYL